MIPFGICVLRILSRLFSSKYSESACVTVQSFLLMHTHSSCGKIQYTCNITKPITLPEFEWSVQQSSSYVQKILINKRQESNQRKQTVQVASLLLSSPVTTASLLYLDTVSAGTLLVLCVDAP